MSRIDCIVPISGGKDSQACLKLAVEKFGSAKVEGLFCDTQFEHPLTYEHIDQLSAKYGVRIHRISAGSVELMVRKHKRFPGGGARHCTEELKVWPSKRFYNDFALANGAFEVWYGMRAGESAAREKRYRGKVSEELYPPHEVLVKYPKRLADLGVRFRLPIIDWTEEEVFSYLGGEENILYFLGFNRVGCFPCLAAGDKYKEDAFRFDETGRKHFRLVRKLESVVGRSVFTSKGGQERNPCEGGAGCAFCEI